MSTICPRCGEEFGTVASCVGEPIPTSHGSLPPVLDDWIPAGRRCLDCGIEAGRYHHAGCELEQCPVCGGQLCTCGHLVAPSDPDGLQTAPEASEAGAEDSAEEPGAGASQRSMREGWSYEELRRLSAKVEELEARIRALEQPAARGSDSSDKV